MLIYIFFSVDIQCTLSRKDYKSKMVRQKYTFQRKYCVRITFKAGKYKRVHVSDNAKHYKTPKGNRKFVYPKLVSRLWIQDPDSR